MLIPNKNRINETLKNPEKCFFSSVFCFFHLFLTYFLSVFRFFRCNFAADKNKLVNQQ